MRIHCLSAIIQQEVLMARTTHSTRHPCVFWQVFGGLFILTATMGMGDCGNNNPAVSLAPSGGSPSGGSSGVVLSASLVQQAYVKASNAEALDSFGNSVALSGDTLVVGVREEDSNATGINGNEADNSAAGSGAVYVFTRTGGVWTQQAYLKASNAEAGDSFGASVALSGDTLVVSATNEDSNATGVGGNQADNSASNSGAVYVFTRTGGIWAQQAYLKASNTEAGDAFGARVALSGDTLVVSAFNEDSNARGSEAIKPTTARQAAARPMCSPGQAASGRSRPI
jgi:drug/metabolite transporter superfamily protein YnfA